MPLRTSHGLRAALVLAAPLALPTAAIEFARVRGPIALELSFEEFVIAAP